MDACPIFRGTRVPVKMPYDNLVEGQSLDGIVEKFPIPDREDLRNVLLRACDLLKAAAPAVTPDLDSNPSRCAATVDEDASPAKDGP